MLYKTFVILTLIFIGLKLLTLEEQISNLSNYQYKTSLGEQLNRIEQKVGSIEFTVDWPHDSLIDQLNRIEQKVNRKIDMKQP
jgi:hypothetical protein